LLGIPTPDALPEVLDDLIVLGVSTVISMLLPVLHINICDTTNEKLEFTLIEHVDKVSGDELVEPCDEILELFFDSFLDAPFSYKSREEC
jgi:hypothetical protein